MRLFDFSLTFGTKSKKMKANRDKAKAHTFTRNFNDAKVVYLTLKIDFHRSFLEF